MLYERFRLFSSEISEDCQRFSRKKSEDIAIKEQQLLTCLTFNEGKEIADIFNLYSEDKTDIFKCVEI